MKLRTSDEAKNCTCPVVYDADARLIVANPCQITELGGFKAFMCDGDMCMAWATAANNRGYCKYIFKDI